MKTGSLGIRIVLLAIGLLLGWVTGYVVGFLWYFFQLIALGYGDSGPQWINRVYDVIWAVSILSGIAASQWYYSYAHKKGRL